MNNSQQFYFSLEKLKGLIAEFENHRSAASEKKTLKGFVFTPGCDKKSKQCCFAFPLYSDTSRSVEVEDGAFLLQNLRFNPGCPYPPPC